MYWYEPDYLADQEIFKPKKGWKRTEQDRCQALRRIRKLPFAAELEIIIGRYEVLDNLNLDVAFLQLWAILEKINDTVGGKYDETIDRATWVFSDRRSQKICWDISVYEETGTFTPVGRPTIASSPYT